jgi:hypothetical protein
MDIKMKHSFYNEDELILVFYGTFEASIDLASKLELCGIEYTHSTTEPIN